VKRGSLVVPERQADILKRAVVIVVAGQANVGFLYGVTSSVSRSTFGNFPEHSMRRWILTETFDWPIEGTLNLSVSPLQ
jgi:hypothetical protein